MPIYITQKLTAQFMGKSVRTIHRYIKDGTLKANPKGKVNVSSLPKEVQEKVANMQPKCKYKQSDLNQYQTRIKFTQSTDQLHNLVNEIIEHFGCFPIGLLPAYKNRLGGPIAPVSASLSRVITDTISSKLYARYSSRIWDDDKINMMEWGFDHEELEKKLCQDIYHWMMNSNDNHGMEYFMTTKKLKALAVNGKEMTLDILSILEDEIQKKDIDSGDPQTRFNNMGWWYFRQEIPFWKQKIQDRLNKAAR